ncbi:MAG: YjzC family protein [Bacillales bacterium]|jgi:hypothetical protein|nr:YjzC family protein [Bacillales bacterium]
MGQQHRFKANQKAPNNGEYIEVGETGDNVKNPKKVKLHAGDDFPETTNGNRQWMHVRKP